MKSIKFLIVFIVLLSFASAEDKIFTQKEFDKKLKEVFSKRMKLVNKQELVKFSNELFKKESELLKIKLDLKKERTLIVNSRKSLKDQISTFHKEQNKYLGCRQEVTKKRDKRILHMVDVISTMKPLNASKVLSVQDSNIAIEILSRLEAVKVSKIFNLMDKEISAKLQKQYLTMKN